MDFRCLELTLAASLIAGMGRAVEHWGGERDEAWMAELARDLTAEPADTERLRSSHLTFLSQWEGVEPTDRRATGKDQAFGWKTAPMADQNEYGNIMQGQVYPKRLGATPAVPEPPPLFTWAAVPEADTWRVWISYVALRSSRHPFRLILSGANEGAWIFGDLVWDAVPGRELEQRLPVRFETEAERELPFTGPAVVWEFKDLPLKAGPTRFAIEGERGAQPVVEALFITRSRTFRPARHIEKEANTLTRHYFRYRYTGGEGRVRSVRFKSFIRYQWYHYRPDFPRRLHYGSVGPIRAVGGGEIVPVGQWSDWTDATEAMTSTGPYCTDFLTVTDSVSKRPVSGGTVEIEWAWRPDSNTVLRAIRCPIWAGQTCYSLPTAHLTWRIETGTNAETAAWGMRAADYCRLFRNESEMLEPVYAAIREAALDDSAALPVRIRFITGCHASPAVWDELIPQLKRLGFNWLVPVTGEWAARFGLHAGGFAYYQSPGHASGTHDPLDPTFERVIEAALKQAVERRVLASADGEGEEEAVPPPAPEQVEYVKMGDEIGPVSSAPFVNGLADLRLAFEAFCREQAAERGAGVEFFGVREWSEVPCLDALPPDAGRLHRRAFYFSRLFHWALSDRYYAAYSRAIRKVFPNAVTWCNYTPGSFMHAGRMETSDWFALARGEGVGLAWGEDWLGGEQMAGVQTVGYYAAIVECAARKRNLPKGFFIVGRTGSVDRKAMMLVARGHTLLYFYDWGPEYTRGAVDTWSHIPSVYPQIGRVVRAVGPADRILAEGRREPARVAVLYNRTQEYWRGSWAGAHFNRLLLYLALQHAHLPTDVIIEEDLTAEGLAPYRVVFVQGLNMTRAGLRALREWVEKGGMVIAEAGTGWYDEFDEPMEEAENFFGARQRLAGLSEGGFAPAEISGHTPIDELTVSETSWTPARVLPVVGPKVVLEPLEGAEVVGRYRDGTAGAVIRRQGQGKTLLWGVMLGHLYRQNAPLDENRKPTRYTAERRALIVKPVVAEGGNGRVAFSEPLTEAVLVEHETGLAICLSDFSERPGAEAVLRIKTDRPIKEIVSARDGPLSWRREGEQVVIRGRVPAPVDVVVLWE
jgi:hypothetical protein